jgi:hypothetical protein
MKRITILSLMGLVLAAAVAIAALRNADDYWAGGLLLGTPLVLCIALIASRCGRERLRARRLGFAVMGGGYFALAFLGLTEANLARLPTSWLLRFVHERVAPPQSFAYTFTATASPGGGQSTFVLSSLNPKGINLVGTTPQPAGIASTPTRPWARVLPGAANLETFSAVGHCLFALLAGLLGAGIAHWYRNAADRQIPE